MPTATAHRKHRETRTPCVEPRAASSANIWNRLVVPEHGDLPVPAARFFLSLDFPESDQRRMVELNQRANDGTLTKDERAELEEYIHVGDVIALLQSKARKTLKKHGQKA